MKTPEERYREGHDHIFSGGPAPRPGDDTIEVKVDGVVIPTSCITSPAEALPSRGPAVTIKWACGGQAFDGTDMRCGLIVAPADYEVDGKGMIVYMAGTPSDILHMVLAAIDSADAFGLAEALKLCIERGVGMGDVKKVLGEEWYL